MKKKLEPIVLELQGLVREFVMQYPGYSGKLADCLGVSRSTIERWAEGKNLPHPTIAKDLVAKIKELLKR